MNHLNHHIRNNSLHSEQDESKPQGLTGLKNLGNTCFMNASLQALSNCPPLTRYMMSEGYRLCRGELTRSYARLMREMWAADRPSVVIPNGILHGIKGVCSIFRDRRQQDAQEFLRYLLDQMHEELKEAVYSDDNQSSGDEAEERKEAESNDDDYETCDSGLSSEISGFGDENPFGNKDEDSIVIWPVESTISKGGDTGNGTWIFKEGKVMKACNAKLSKLFRNQEHKKKKIRYRSIITDIFDGKIISSVECLTCGNVSTTKENFQDLSLPIPNKDHLQLLRVTGLQSIKDSESSNPESKTEEASSLKPSSPAPFQSPTSPNSMPKSPVNSTQQSDHSKKDSKHNRNRNWKLATLAPLYTGLHMISSAVANLPSVYHLIWSWLDYILSWLLGPPITLQDCLQAFFSLDELKGDDMYNCDKCKKLRNGVKLSRVLSLPHILCIHLKRFRHDLPYPQKITRHVSFPLTGLDMSLYMSPTRRRKASTNNSYSNNCNSINLSTNENCASNNPSSRTSSSFNQVPLHYKTQSNGSNCYFDLAAVICHTGTYASGHYITYALNESNQTWYEFDDQYVTPVDPQTIVSCEAYVLFYRRSSSLPEDDDKV